MDPILAGGIILVVVAVLIFIFVKNEAGQKLALAIGIIGVIAFVLWLLRVSGVLNAA